MSVGTSASSLGGLQGEGAGLERLDPLQPLLAGAHARGMADALELAGVAAVLIDGQGLVLHAGDRAQALFGPDLRIAFDHLVGGDGDSTCQIQNLILKGLGSGELMPPVWLPRANQAPLILHARRISGAAANVYQILKLLIIIEEAPISRRNN